MSSRRLDELSGGPSTLIDRGARVQAPAMASPSLFLREKKEKGTRRPCLRCTSLLHATASLKADTSRPSYPCLHFKEDKAGDPREARTCPGSQPGRRGARTNGRRPPSSRAQTHPRHCHTQTAQQSTFVHTHTDKATTPTGPVQVDEGPSLAPRNRPIFKGTKLDSSLWPGSQVTPGRKEQNIYSRRETASSFVFQRLWTHGGRAGEKH